MGWMVARTATLWSGIRVLGCSMGLFMLWKSYIFRGVATLVVTLHSGFLGTVGYLYIVCDVIECSNQQLYFI